MLAKTILNYLKPSENLMLLLVMLIVFACGGAQNINLRNYARSYFCAFLILLILVVFVLIILLATGSSLSVLDNLF